MNTVQPISHLKRAFREDTLLKQPLHCQLLSPGELGHRRTIPLPESGGLSSGQRVMKLVRTGPGEDNLAGFENDCRPCLSGAHKLVCKRPVTRRKRVSSLEQSVPPYPSHPLTECETEGGSRRRSGDVRKQIRPTRRAASWRCNRSRLIISSWVTGHPNFE